MGFNVDLHRSLPCACQQFRARLLVRFSELTAGNLDLAQDGRRAYVPFPVDFQLSVRSVYR